MESSLRKRMSTCQQSSGLWSTCIGVNVDASALISCRETKGPRNGSVDWLSPVRLARLFA